MSLFCTVSEILLISQILEVTTQTTPTRVYCHPKATFLGDIQVAKSRFGFIVKPVSVSVNKSTWFANLNLLKPDSDLVEVGWLGFYGTFGTKRPYAWEGCI